MIITDNNHNSFSYNCYCFFVIYLYLFETTVSVTLTFSFTQYTNIFIELSTTIKFFFHFKSYEALYNIGLTSKPSAQWLRNMVSSYSIEWTHMPSCIRAATLQLHKTVCAIVLFCSFVVRCRQFVVPKTYKHQGTGMAKQNIQMCEFICQVVEIWPQKSQNNK